MGTWCAIVSSFIGPPFYWMYSINYYSLDLLSLSSKGIESRCFLVSYSCLQCTLCWLCLWQCRDFESISGDLSLSALPPSLYSREDSVMLLLVEPFSLLCTYSNVVRQIIQGDPSIAFLLGDIINWYQCIVYLFVGHFHNNLILWISKGNISRHLIFVVLDNLFKLSHLIFCDFLLLCH